MWVGVWDEAKLLQQRWNTGGEDVPPQAEKLRVSHGGIMGLSFDTFCFRIISIIPRFDSSQEMHNFGIGTKPAKWTQMKWLVDSER